RQLEPAVTIRRAHHGNLDAHVPQSSYAIRPVSFDWGAPLEVEAKLGEELNGGIDVFYHDADVVHTLDGHDVSLALIRFLRRSAAHCLKHRRHMSVYNSADQSPADFRTPVMATAYHRPAAPASIGQDDAAPCKKARVGRVCPVLSGDDGSQNFFWWAS